MQTATAQMLAHFDPTITVERVINEVPVYVENGEKIGTSPGHLAAYLAKAGYKTTVAVFDTELFDRSWIGSDAQEVVGLLKQREQHIPNNAWLAAYHHILVDGWELFANCGGQFDFSPLNGQLLRDYLQHGPYILMVNSTYLNSLPKAKYDQELDKFKKDPIEGRSLTHATTCAGYKDGKFLLIDPDPPEGIDHERWIESDHVIASIMAAQTESDNMLITVRK